MAKTAAPKLILLSGLPGSGKSTLARAYTAKYDTVHLNSDLVRTELGLRGHYQAGDKERVYRALLEKVHRQLASGRDVVVDSTFYRQAIREPFDRIAGELNIPAYWVLVEAAEDTIRERLRTPRPDSEADFAVYEKIRDQFEAWERPPIVLGSGTVQLYPRQP